MNLEKILEDYFRTTDLDLAAHLISFGLTHYKFYELHHTQPTIIIFKDKKKAEKLEKDFLYNRTKLRNGIFDFQREKKAERLKEEENG